MTRARNEIVDPNVTPYYHCISRCVRRAFLCGFDKLSQKNFDHRKTWVVDRLALLSHTFAIEVAAYAIMSNHLHCLLRIDTDQASSWTEDEVINRWSKLYTVPPLLQKYRKEECSEAEMRQAQRTIELWRERLSSLSWFMRCLNEYIARMANQEDNCKGRFWEGRFKSQALLDEAAILTCMTYIDLNPIRAKITGRLETSDFTSIQQRLNDAALKQDKRQTESHKQDKTTQKRKSLKKNPNPIRLMPLVPYEHDPHPNSLGFTEKDYFQLIDWAGRCVREGKHGKIDDDSPPILERLEVDPFEFVLHMSGTHRKILIERPIALGTIRRLKAFAKRLGAAFIRGQGLAAGLYGVRS